MYVKKGGVSEVQTEGGGKGKGLFLSHTAHAGMVSHSAFRAEGSRVGRECGGQSRTLGRWGTDCRGLSPHLGSTVSCPGRRGSTAFGQQQPLPGHAQFTNAKVLSHLKHIHEHIWPKPFPVLANRLCSSGFLRSSRPVPQQIHDHILSWSPSKWPLDTLLRWWGWDWILAAFLYSPVAGPCHRCPAGMASSAHWSKMEVPKGPSVSLQGCGVAAPQPSSRAPLLV